MEVRDKELHRIAVTAIIYRRRGDTYEYLITKHSPKKKVFPNRWTVPGGGMETDDYIHDTNAQDKEGQWYYALEKTLRREVREEVNVEIREP
ncbi:NUDIX domain-containing protein [Candidatus Wolfebacteria bacterium]|nr:NUDIX domain-containing protein [Candidatus Wolfebacteria bacterium]